jgi:hypothetical protein
LGLDTGCFIWGGPVIFDFPKTSPDVRRTRGWWGFWMPGFMQFLTGIYLLTGLTWLNVFRNAAPLDRRASRSLLAAFTGPR